MEPLNDYFAYIKKNYASAFDFTEPAMIQGREYRLQADFHSHTDKYVLVKKAKLWSADSHEHCIFQTYEEAPDFREIHGLKEMMVSYMEPELARQGREEMEKDHMYTYLTLILISEKRVSPETIKAVKKFRYTKYYKLYARGYSEGRILLVDRAAGKIYSNPAARELQKFYKKSLRRKVS